MSLARGLDYYTGVIYEAVCEASAPPGFTVNPPVADSSSTTKPANPKPPKAPKKTPKDKDQEEELDETQIGVGSIAAGGRYDELVGMFAAAAAGETGKGKKSGGIPCVGVSVGVERVFSILREKMMKEERIARAKETEVYVIGVADASLTDRMGIVKRLWDAGIKVRIGQPAV